MAKRGRKAHVVPNVPFKCRVRKDVAEAVDEYFLDPVTGNIKYGEKGYLVTMLLSNWLATLKHKPGVAALTPSDA